MFAGLDVKLICIINNFFIINDFFLKNHLQRTKFSSFCEYMKELSQVLKTVSNDIKAVTLRALEKDTFEMGA